MICAKWLVVFISLYSSLLMCHSLTVPVMSCLHFFFLSFSLFFYDLACSKWNFFSKAKCCKISIVHYVEHAVQLWGYIIPRIKQLFVHIFCQVFYRCRCKRILQPFCAMCWQIFWSVACVCCVGCMCDNCNFIHLGYLFRIWHVDFQCSYRSAFILCRVELLTSYVSIQ